MMNKKGFLQRAAREDQLVTEFILNNSGSDIHIANE